MGSLICLCSYPGGWQFFAAPSQLTVPTSLRWGLVWQDVDAGLISLGRAVPRAWLSDPNASLTVNDAPVNTRLLSSGRIGFTLRQSLTAVESNVNQKTIIASIFLVDSDSGSVNTGTTLMLRVRAPQSWGKVKSIISGLGDNWTQKSVSEDLVLQAPFPTKAALQNIAFVY